MRCWEFVRAASWLPELQKKGGIYEPLLSWTDLNGDGLATPNEFNVRKFSETIKTLDGKTSPLFGFRMFYPRADMSLSGSWGVQIPTPTLRADGTFMTFSKATFAVPPAMAGCWGEDGNNGLLLSSGYFVEGAWEGFKNGKLAWTYPVSWEQFLTPQYSGHMVEPTRLLGAPFDRGDAKDILCMNGERGNMY